MTAAGADGFHLLTDLALILCVAAVTTVIFQRIKQPVILGYLLAGMIVGPHLPIPLFADEKVAHTLSELGVNPADPARDTSKPPALPNSG